ncbi:MAG TPA: class I SAM-dependent methyltransferase, partial [Thermoanaerobaculia bacterium]
LWERQRVFNLILLDHLERAKAVETWHGARLLPLEGTLAEGLAEIMRHNDALFARVDQKLDGYRREARDLLGSLGAALAAVEQTPGTEAGRYGRAREEHAYFELERRYRGTEEEIGERIARYLPYLEGKDPVLDLGCGRGEALALLHERGVAARGVDSSERMVALCRERGLDAAAGDLFEHLAGTEEGSLGAVVSFHVVEHLPPEALDRLVRLAWRALRPGGVLILETPNPLSLVVAARNFWLDPTHVRPVHPEALQLLLQQAGFAAVEHLELRPFAEAERLPEIDLATLPAAQHELADRVNRLRDGLDELLFGFQDYAVIGTKKGA